MGISIIVFNKKFINLNIQSYTTLQIPFETLKTATSRFTYALNGDEFETKHSKILTPLFTNSEVFWKLFITPLTKRINNNVNPKISIRAREKTSITLQELAAYHYSIFLNIVYVNDCFEEKQMAFFENFYAHLSTICDLTEEFLLQVSFITEQCKGSIPTLLKELTREDVINLAREYYDKNYPKDYEYYFSK
jgi:hypothetical protein